MARLKKERN